MSSGAEACRVANAATIRGPAGESASAVKYLPRRQRDATDTAEESPGRPRWNGLLVLLHGQVQLQQQGTPHATGYRKGQYVGHGVQITPQSPAKSTRPSARLTQPPWP